MLSCDGEEACWLAAMCELLYSSQYIITVPDVTKLQYLSRLRSYSDYWTRFAEYSSVIGWHPTTWPGLRATDWPWGISFTIVTNGGGVRRGVGSSHPCVVTVYRWYVPVYQWYVTYHSTSLHFTSDMYQFTREPVTVIEDLLTNYC